MTELKRHQYFIMNSGPKLRKETENNQGAVMRWLILLGVPLVLTVVALVLLSTEAVSWWIGLVLFGVSFLQLALAIEKVTWDKYGE